MYFNSYIFMLAFMPIVIIGYYLLNHTCKYIWGQVWLTLMSLVFIGYQNVYYALITVISILAGYFWVWFVTNNIFSEKKKKMGLTCGIVFHVGILLYFKYTNFFIENISGVIQKNIPLLDILLPIGISFYTFQQIAYLVDCYKDNRVKCSFREYCLFITYFPKFLQGPIVLHEDLLPQFRDNNNKHFSWEHLSRGLYAIALGLGKKVLIADNIALLVNAGYEDIVQLNTVSALLTMVAYSVQLYFDFSGYCDIAMGVGEILQIQLPVNFNSPYKAVTVTDIWARWHMTLTRFLTRYIYIPLGGNRRGNIRMYINTFIVFFISGLWHGAAWTFIVWGVMHGIGMIVSKFLARCNVFLPKAAGWFGTFFFWVVSFSIFRASSISEAIQLFAQLLNGGLGRIDSMFYESIAKHVEMSILHRIDFMGILDRFPEIIVAGLVLLPLLGCVCMKNTQEKLENFRPTYAKLAITVALIFYSIISMEGVTVFLYAKF